MNSLILGALMMMNEQCQWMREMTEDDDKKSGGANSESYQSNMCSEDGDLTHVATVALDTDSENEVSSDQRSFKQVNVKVCPPAKVSSPSKSQRMPLSMISVKKKCEYTIRKLNIMDLTLSFRLQGLLFWPRNWAKGYSQIER